MKNVNVMDILILLVTMICAAILLRDVLGVSQMGGRCGGMLRSLV